MKTNFHMKSERLWSTVFSIDITFSLNGYLTVSTTASCCRLKITSQGRSFLPTCRHLFKKKKAIIFPLRDKLCWKNSERKKETRKRKTNKVRCTNRSNVLLRRFCVTTPQAFEFHLLLFRRGTGCSLPLGDISETEAYHLRTGRFGRLVVTNGKRL